MINNKEYIAHIREYDNKRQALHTHLTEVSKISKRLAAKFGSESAGELIGLMHDFGKYSQAFQSYLGSATGQINPDEDDYVDAKGLKGKIDHSTAGAQWVFKALSTQGAKDTELLCGQILSICIASHHSGLINCLDDEGKNKFLERIKKLDEKTNLKECTGAADPHILKAAQELANIRLLEEMQIVIHKILSKEDIDTNPKIQEFYLGCYTRFLFSCLIDADRINSADFEHPAQAHLRSTDNPDWDLAISRLETQLSHLTPKHPIDEIRKQISDTCKSRATDPQGIYTLSVPTGGGKTLASLRYALQHAKTHDLERIIFIIPYTSIIEQNADVVRQILEDAGDSHPWVLEHHSNLEPEQQTWQSKLITDNWDAPIVFTTMVQFLETCFSGGTRGVRRLHAMANSVLIFDEIQTLPIKCVHLFCNTINFMVQLTRTTSILCTATQPLLNALKRPEYGQVQLAQDFEIVGNTDAVKFLFDQLERVDIVNRCKSGGWTLDELASFVIEQFEVSGSCLVIVNTKAWAQNLYRALQLRGIAHDTLFHLSTNQCPAHRKALLDGDTGIKARLRQELPLICISTQLIEAGVDVSFGSVIRFLAGLDSIAQAAGRCNRHGESTQKASVSVVNPDQETTDMLTEIKIGKEKSERIFNEIKQGHLSKPLAPETMQRYFQYYFHDRADDMSYPFQGSQGESKTLLNILSDNAQNAYPYKNNTRLGKSPMLMQSFMTAGEAFRAIEAPTQSIIVPYGSVGREIIADLGAYTKDYPQFYRALKKAQKYGVNVFPNAWRELQETGNAIYEIGDTGIYVLDEQYYSDEFGLATEVVNTVSPDIL